MSIYKPCDIRGSATLELTVDLYRHWGSKLGGQLPPGAKFVIGGDIRASTPAFLAALCEGLCRSALDVVNLGILPTPMVYYAKRRLQAAGCAVVTGSHHSADSNGLKWMLGDRPPRTCEVAAMRDAGDDLARRPSTARSLDVSFDYVACMQETFVDSLGAQLHVVIDPLGGVWAGRARRYLQAIFPQCLFSAIHDTADPRYCEEVPDCARAQRLEGLSEAVYRERAHLGIAFDGDGDRLAVVDNEGVVLSPEETTWVLLQCLGKELQGQQFVHDMKFSDRISEAAGQFGAQPIRERSGHGFLCARMRETDALFGAESNGHYFHRVLEGCDDGLYTACRLIAYLARSKDSLADMRRDCPPLYMTPDLRIAVPWSEHSAILDGVRTAWEGFPQRFVDGVRVDIPGGWALVRSSVSEPALTFRFEGLDWHALDDIVHRFCARLTKKLGGQVWEAYSVALGKERP